MNAVLYIHGKNGSAAEAEHYRQMFPRHEVLGLDYQTFTPWETGKEIRDAAEALVKEHGKITLVANSAGAFFSMHAQIGPLVRRAFFISPVVDMEKLIREMMIRANVTEEELRERRVIHTSFGEDLSWEYLCWLRDHPIRWDVPTEILYGGLDALTARETVSAFARAHGAGLTVMEDGEHWFHTAEQLRFLDNWLRDRLFMVELKAITEENFIDAFNLRLAPGQEAFVSHPIRSLAQAYVYRDQCRPFGICADDKMVGYVMVIYDYDIPEYDIWHMMIDESAQGRGYGGAALDRVIEYIKTKPFGDSGRVALTCNKNNPIARRLYESRGFSATGVEDEDEIEMAMTV